MSDIHKNPHDVVDLSVAVSYNDGDFATIGCRAYVYGPSGSAISGSPFTLTHVANGLFQLKSAFQIDVNSGTYDVTYIFYTDGTFATEHGSYGHVHDTLTIAIQSTSGLGSGQLLEFDEEALIKLLKREIKIILEEEIKPFQAKLQQLAERDFNVDLKPVIDQIKSIDIKVPDFGGVIQSVLESRQIINNRLEKVNESIKRNSSLVAKSAEGVNKNVFTPVIKSIEIIKDETIKSVKAMEASAGENNRNVIEQIKELDIKQSLKTSEKLVASMLDTLNEDVRKKLKFALEKMMNILVMGTKMKQKINIELKEK